jgi:hypothetical protein
MKKYLLLTLTLLLCASLFSCAFNFNEELIFGDPEVPSADIDKPTEEVTQIPTEEPTEKPTEPIITIDGITFDKTLETKLNAAKTYADVCNILGKEGTLVSDYEFTVWYMLGEPPYHIADKGRDVICIKFKNSDDLSVVCEDFKVTTEKHGFDSSVLPERLSEDISIGKSYSEVDEALTPKYLAYVEADPIDYCWSFGDGDDEIKIYTSFCGWGNSKDSLQTCAVKTWDYTETIADAYLKQIKIGQTYAEVCEIIGFKGIFHSWGAYWDLEDGKRLTIAFADKPGLESYTNDSMTVTGRYSIKIIDEQ